MSFVGAMCILGSVVCWFGGVICWLRALATKPPGVSWFDSDLWLRLPPEGARLRNVGFLFWLGAAALGIAGMLVFKGR